jgi:hypothetical protein
MTDLVEARRREATRAAVRYFLLAFVVVLAMSGTTVYAVWSARVQAHESYAIRVAYCRELERLKTQNREDVAQEEHDYTRNLRLLGIKDTPELRRAAEAGWARKLRRNAPRACPYRA